MCSQRAEWTRTGSRCPPPMASFAPCLPASTTTTEPAEVCRCGCCWALWLLAMLDILGLSWILLSLRPLRLALDVRRSCLIHPVSKRKARGSTRPTLFMAMDPGKTQHNNATDDSGQNKRQNTLKSTKSHQGVAWTSRTDNAW